MSRAVCADTKNRSDIFAKWNTFNHIWCCCVLCDGREKSIKKWPRRRLSGCWYIFRCASKCIKMWRNIQTRLFGDMSIIIRLLCLVVPIVCCGQLLCCCCCCRRRLLLRLCFTLEATFNPLLLFQPLLWWVSGDVCLRGCWNIIICCELRSYFIESLMQPSKEPRQRLEVCSFFLVLVGCECMIVCFFTWSKLTDVDVGKMLIGWHPPLRASALGGLGVVQVQ